MSMDYEANSSFMRSGEYKLHEVYFAEYLGVKRNEFFFDKLMAIASVALYDLPSGWSVGVYEFPENEVLS